MNPPVFQFPPAGLFIPFDIPRMQADAEEARELRLRLVELYEQKDAVEADKQRLVSDKVDLVAALEQSKEDIQNLEAEVQELRKRERMLQRRVKPDILFLEVLLPMLKLEPKPEDVPEVMEVEIRRACGPTDNYAEIETRTFNTVTNELVREKTRLIPKWQKSPALRLTYHG